MKVDTQVTRRTINRSYLSVSYLWFWISNWTNEKTNPMGRVELIIKKSCLCVTPVNIHTKNQGQNSGHIWSAPSRHLTSRRLKKKTPKDYEKKIIFDRNVVEWISIFSLTSSVPQWFWASNVGDILTAAFRIVVHIIHVPNKLLTLIRGGTQQTIWKLHITMCVACL